MINSDTQVLSMWYFINKRSQCNDGVLFIGNFLTLHFCGLKAINQECDHCASESRSCCRAMQSVTELIWEYKRTSSVYSLIWLWAQAGKSLMYIKKSKDANTMPWDTHLRELQQSGFSGCSTLRTVICYLEKI